MKKNVAQNSTHYLNLKVMRLSKPQFNPTIPIFNENTDIMHELEFNRENISRIQFGVSELISLPTSTIETFTGETFRCFITILNHTTIPASNVSLKIYIIQAPKNIKHVLLDLENKPIPLIDSGKSHDLILSKEIEEKGSYTLLCDVKYLAYNETQSRFFQKMFKFPVEDPFTITYQNFKIEREKDTQTIVKISIKNNTKYYMCINEIQFLASSSFELINTPSINNKEEDEEDINSILENDDAIYLLPGSIHQLVYKLKHLSFEKESKKLEEGFGKLRVTWSGAHFQRSVFVTPPIIDADPEIKKVDLKLSEIPNKVQLENPFVVKCTITNLTETMRPYSLKFIPENMKGIRISGISGTIIGPIPPMGSKSIDLVLFPIKSGIQSITGIELVDLHKNQKFEFNNIDYVFVEFNI
eukprot:TRINITY_DN16918_c0_g1_i1.p1 TRINITY_DN16918_c0_g1~~TRINITY_DN16918_c0_g1_i1.p1  ORF type:complete len:414 (-),score=94.45 TRINITY_DN16918_c0_g1_i1:108-1349(-)